MKQLPLDVITIIATFLTLQELGHAYLSDKDFNLPSQKRRKRMNWCREKIHQRRFRRGPCADTTCCRIKATCIHFEPLKTEVLSNYCAEHTRKYTNVNLLDTFYL